MPRGGEIMPMTITVIFLCNAQVCRCSAQAPNCVQSCKSDHASVRKGAGTVTGNGFWSVASNRIASP